MFEDLTDDQIARLRKSLDTKIDKRGPDDCWNWTGSTETGKPNSRHHNYGKVKIPRTHHTARAHRASYYLEHDEDPGGMFVMHECDNPLCCNPKHLSLGTHHDNMLDMRLKGRTISLKPGTQVGDKNLHAKLAEGDVLEIRAASAKGVPNAIIAKKHSVTHANIYAIVKRKTWKHI